MQRRKQKLAVAIPVSIVSDIPHIREKTLKIGLVGRAAAIFRVNEIVVFSDNPGADQKLDRDMIVTLLSYMETPQYLRKRLFKIKSELRYAGILPPLRTPHHPLAKRARDLKVGDYREGVIMSITDSGSIVDMGVERPALLPDQKIPVNTRVTVKVANLGKRPRVSLADREEIEAYWGYTVTSSKASFGKIAKSGAYNLVVATSKMAPSLMSAVDELAERWKKSSNVLLAFGAPSHGLQEIVAQEKLGLDDVADFTVNTIPDQGTETVRTEEALYASLAMLNAFIK